MGIDIKALSPWAQAQVFEKWQVQEARQEGARPGAPSKLAGPVEKPGKYHNTPTEAQGIRFDSKKEALRFQELRLREAAGEIQDLRLQVDFTLQEGYATPTGERVRAIRYRADFTYQERATIRRPGPGGGVEEGEAWALVVEDVKSTATRTKEYLIKRKMMEDRFHISIREV